MIGFDMSATEAATQQTAEEQVSTTVEQVSDGVVDLNSSDSQPVQDGEPAEEREVPSYSDQEEDEEELDPEEEFESTPDDESTLDSVTLDGDFVGHPFRGNQHRKASQESGAAVRASMRAKHAEKNGDDAARRKAHRSAYHSHMAAAEESSGKAAYYHKTMAEFHKGRSSEVAFDAVDGVEVNVFKEGDKVYDKATGMDLVVTHQKGYQVFCRGRKSPLHANHLARADGKGSQKKLLDGIDGLAELRLAIRSASGVIEMLALAKKLLETRSGSGNEAGEKTEPVPETEVVPVATETEVGMPVDAPAEETKVAEPNAKRDADLLALTSIANGTHEDMLSPEIGDIIESIHDAYKDDAEIVSAVNSAIAAYERGLLAATAA